MSGVQKPAVGTDIYFKAKLNPIELSLLASTDIILGLEEKCLSWYRSKIPTADVFKVVFNNWDTQISCPIVADVNNPTSRELAK